VVRSSRHPIDDTPGRGDYTRPIGSGSAGLGDYEEGLGLYLLDRAPFPHDTALKVRYIWEPVKMPDRLDRAEKIASTFSGVVGVLATIAIAVAGFRIGETYRSGDITDRQVSRIAELGPLLLDSDPKRASLRYTWSLLQAYPMDCVQLLCPL
jgi:hypothetical protein